MAHCVLTIDEYNQIEKMPDYAKFFSLHVSFHDLEAIFIMLRR